MKNIAISAFVFLGLAGLLLYGAVNSESPVRAWYSCGPSSCYVEVDLTDRQRLERPETVVVEILAPPRTARGAHERYGLVAIGRETIDLEGRDLGETVEVEVRKGLGSAKRVRVTVEDVVVYAVGS